MSADDREGPRAEQRDSRAPAPSAASMYARVFPLFALGLLVWLLVGDAVLAHTTHGARPFFVSWGLRTVQSGKDPKDPALLVRTYGEASELLSAQLEGEGAGAALVGVKAARESLAAYESLQFWGGSALAILVIAALLFLLAAGKPGVAAEERAKTHLIACLIAFVGVFWFRWSFSRVSGSLAYAADGDYVFTGPVVAVLLGLSVTVFVAIAIWAQARAAAKQLAS
jgi:hypothetical protein